MKKTALILILLFLTSLFFSCKKDKLITDPSAKLDFSQDSVLFDTLFTTIGSTTKYFRVYNNNDQKILISNIRLARGQSSPYRFNADGLYGTSVNDIEIDAHDSIFVFIEVTVDPTNVNNPLVIRDSLLFETNGNIQDVDLEAWGQDAYFHLPADKIVLSGGVLYYGIDSMGTWPADKPHVVYGYTVVDSSNTLNIDPGVNVYFHNNGGIWVYRFGTIKVNGTYTQPVTFQGDRLEPEYQDEPGQWDRIWINEGSTQNEINYAIIKNGFIGIEHQVIMSIVDPMKLKINNTIIQNMSGWGIFTGHGNIEGFNNVVVNCGKNVMALTQGGKYKFYHCTFANYYNKEERQDAVLFMNNYDAVNGTLAFDTTSYFGNCIFDGANTEEVGFDTSATANAFNVLFENCMLKTSYNLNNSHFINCLQNQPAAFKNPGAYDFKINSNSAAKDAGKPSLGIAFPVDLDNKARNVDMAPDIGAYEFQ